MCHRVRLSEILNDQGFVVYLASGSSYTTLPPKHLGCTATWATGGGSGSLCGQEAIARIGDFWVCRHHKKRFLDVLGDVIQRINQHETEREDQRKKEAQTRSQVYFVERDGFIKIGTTIRLRDRLNALSRGQMPEGMTVGPVRLLATMPGDHFIERCLHLRFAEYRIPKTEWFYPCIKLRLLIDRLQRRAQS